MTVGDSGPRWRAESIVRAVRHTLAQQDPAKLGKREARTDQGDAYNAAAVQVARVLINKGTPDAAVRVLDAELRNHFGVAISRRKSRTVKRRLTSIARWCERDLLLRVTGQPHGPSSV